jgi:hypothetical protein
MVAKGWQKKVRTTNYHCLSNCITIAELMKCIYMIVDCFGLLGELTHDRASCVLFYYHNKNKVCSTGSMFTVGINVCV